MKAGAMIEKTDFWFSSAGQNRRLHIYLPDDYYETEERYPVMYMFDG
ncbi:MAG: alpha/beta hydrolase-fold protein, partial [Alphaproteobacteria bacterium]